MNAETKTSSGATSTTGAAPLMEARGISKHFGAVVALSDVDFHVNAGEVVGLIGDNGAGKSTFIKTLSGTYQPDEGQIFVEGKPVEFSGPRDAQDAGIETVYQDLALFDELSIAANIFAAREEVSGVGLLKHKSMRDFTKKLIGRLGVDLPGAGTVVRNLSGGQRQAVALARAVGFGSRIAFFDEPTSALSKAASEHVLAVISDLRGQGFGCVFIGHNLEHVMEICDRIVVLRQGRVAGELQKADFSVTGLVTLMVAG